MPKGVYIRTDYHKKMISEGKIGIKYSKEHCKNISKGKKGCKSWNKGITGYSTSKKGRKESLSLRKKLSEAQKKAWKEGKYTEERNKNVSKALKRIGHKPEVQHMEKHWNWKGGRYVKDNRVFITIKDLGTVQESHYIYLTHHQIPTLPKGCVIHHRDMNSLNNDIDNLAMMPWGEHNRMHELFRQGKIIQEKNNDQK